MNSYISKENLHRFCTTNEKYVKGPIWKVVVEFPGSDGNSCLGGNFEALENETAFGKLLGEQGILTVYTFIGPWSWMRKISVDTVDDVLDRIFEKYELNQDTPIVAAGGSMGGHGALMFTLKSKYKISACAISCPTTDLYALPKSDRHNYFCACVYFAFADCEGDFEEVMKANSPLYLVDKLPRIPYYMIICDQDEPLPCEEHAFPFLKKMQEQKHNIESVLLEGKGHCEHPEEVFKAFVEFIIKT